jgi:hypothetical protein
MARWAEFILREEVAETIGGEMNRLSEILNFEPAVRTYWTDR